MDKIKTYQNGLTLIVSEGGALSTTFAIMIGSGCVNETAKNNGISHFIEHMSFKGTKNYTSLDISALMDYEGASYNAYTSNETTCFYAQTIPENLEKTFSILSEAVFMSTYPDEEAQREKEVILEEIKMSEDTPDDVCFELSSRAYFGDDGYGRAILGTESNVKSFTKNDVLKYVSENYVAENTVVTFAGNITMQRAEKLVEKYIITVISSGKKAPCPAHNVINKKQFLSKDKDIEQAHFCLSFPSCSYLSENKVKSEIFSAILGGGMSSRLFVKVREELGLAYSVYSYNTRAKDVGTFNVYAGVNADKLGDAFNAVIEVISNLKEKGVTERELLKAKNQIKSSTLFSMERSSNRVQVLSKHYLMTNKLYDFGDKIKQVEAVSVDDVMSVASKIDFNDMATAVVGKNVKPLKYKN